mgnify:CR=1 FL=1
MKTLWIIIFLVILLRSIWRRMERTGPAGRYEEPVGTVDSDPLEQPPEHLPGERGRRKLNLPDYITGRRSEPVTSGGEGVIFSGPAKATVEERRPPAGEGPGRKSGEVPESRHLTENLHLQPLAVTSRKSYRQRAEEYFSDFSAGPEQVLKGLVWAEILGPRGGRQMKRRK